MQPYYHDPVEHFSGEQLCRIRLFGEIDATTTPTLTEQLRLLPVGVDVEVDLSRVRFMSAAGVTLLLALREQVVRGGACLHVTGVPAAIHRVFVLVGVRDHFLFLGAPGDPAGGTGEASTVVVDLPPRTASRRGRPVALAPRWHGRSRIQTCRGPLAVRRIGIVRAGEEGDDDVD